MALTELGIRTSSTRSLTITVDRSLRERNVSRSETILVAKGRSAR